MSDLYGDKNCLDFSKEEWEMYLARPIKELYGIELIYSYSDDDKVDEIQFKGISDDDLTIQPFNNGMVSFFVQKEMIIFIDDKMKNTVRGVEGCIIYEGSLRDKSHNQILNLFLELFTILLGTEKIEYKEQLASKKGYYRINNYNVNLVNKRKNNSIIKFENITFNISNS